MRIARASMSVLPGARAPRQASVAFAPVTPLCCGYFFLALYDASCSVGLLHKTHAAAPTRPISFATAAPQAAALPTSQWKMGARLFFNFYASSRPKLPTLGPFPPFFASGVTPDARNGHFASSAEARVLPRGMKRADPINDSSFQRLCGTMFPQPSSLTGGKVTKQNKFSSACQLANIQIFCTG